MSPKARLSILIATISAAASAASPPIITSTTLNTANGQLTITGANLSPTGAAPSVSFDNTALTLVSFSSTIVVANLPATFGPGTYLLQVTNSNSQSGTFDITLGAVG